MEEFETKGPIFAPLEKVVQRRKRLKYMDITEQRMGEGGMETVQRTVVAPKGIYKTPHGYRVQLNMESGRGVKSKNTDMSSVSQRGKFSRNTKKFEEAVWLYEIAILISDCPHSVQTLILHGNFDFMFAMKVCFIRLIFIICIYLTIVDYIF